MKTILFSLAFVLSGFGVSTLMIEEPLSEAVTKDNVILNFNKDDFMVGCRVQLTRLVCEQTEGMMTPDAIYMKIWLDESGPTIWPERRMRMSVGNEFSLSNQSPLNIRCVYPDIYDKGKKVNNVTQ